MLTFIPDVLIEIDYPIIPNTLDSDDWLFIFDGPPVFNSFSAETPFPLNRTTAPSTSKGTYSFFATI